MPRYQVVQNSFIDGRFYDARRCIDEGRELPVVEYAGIPGPNLKPLDDEGKKAAAKFKEAAAQDAKRLSKAADGVENLAELLAA